MSRPALGLLLGLLGLALGGCGSHQGQPVAEVARPPVSIRDGTPVYRADMASIPDPVPRPEPITSAGNKSPYTVLGGTYRVEAVPPGWRQRGLSSWYGTKFHGQNTSNGEPYDVYAMTAAHKTLPIPCYVRVTNLENGSKVVVRVNDRGPFHEGRVIDLSYAAAFRLGFAGKGTAPVELELLDPNAPEWVARRNGLTPREQPARNGSAPQPDSVVATADPPPYTVGRWLQVGAFRSLAGARHLGQRLRGLLGREATIQSVTSASGEWHRVRVGPMESVAALQQAQREIAAARLGPAQIVAQ